MHNDEHICFMQIRIQLPIVATAPAPAAATSSSAASSALSTLVKNQMYAGA